MDKLIEIKLDIKFISFIFALSKTNIKNMNSDKLYKLYSLVKFNLTYLSAKNNENIARDLAIKHKLYFIENELLIKKIDELKNFEGNLWDRSFWGLRRHDSISAHAAEPSSFIERLRNRNITLDNLNDKDFIF